MIRRCDIRGSHDPHGWVYERIVRDEAASLRAGEPVGVEKITYEWCDGNPPRPELWCGDTKRHRRHDWKWIVPEPVQWMDEEDPASTAKIVREICPGYDPAEERYLP